jgi:hypothetical protein
MPRPKRVSAKRIVALKLPEPKRAKPNEEYHAKGR